MGYLVLPFEGACHRDFRAEEGFEVCLSNQGI